MAEHLVFQAKQAALNALRKNLSEFGFHNIVMRIQHAHHNEYQVLLPGGREIFRIYAGETPAIISV